MEAHLPPNKLQHTREELTNWLSKKKAIKRQTLSLVGLLHHAAKFIHHGRSFVSRMYVTAAKVKELDYYTRLNLDFCSNLLWWNIFLSTWKGHHHTLTHLEHWDAAQCLVVIYGSNGNGPQNSSQLA